MDASDIPYKFAVPFAAAAAGSVTNPIPLTTATPYETSLELGFPPSTAAAGGAPRYPDVQGILFAATAWNQWQQAGGAVPYDAAFQTAIGGYPAYAQVASVATPGLIWVSQVDDNVTDPDSAGAGWLGYTPTAQPFTGKFISSPQAISGTDVLLGHGLGAAPFGIRVTLVNVTGEFGYSTGNEVDLPAVTYDQGGGGTGAWVSTGSDATDVWVNFSDVTRIPIGVKTGGLPSTPNNNGFITAANWTVRLRAWL